MMSSLRYDLGKCAGVSRIEASRMTEPTRADADRAGGWLADHRGSRLTIVHGVGGGAVGGCRIDRIAVLEAVEASPEGLDGGEEICGGQRQAVQAEGVGRVGLLRGDDTAAWPLGSPIGS